MGVSAINSSLTEEGLRTAPEGQYLERKGRDTRPTKIANELIGMLNAGGGTLVYGIARDGTVEDLQRGSGLLPDEPRNLDSYRKLAHDFIKPPPDVELEEVYLSVLIRELETFLEASFRDYYYLDMAKGKFMRVPEFPKDAWLEGIVNALCHRSYNIQGNPIMIRHFDDRLEIANSGPLPAQVTVENIERERFARNVRIARALNDFGYVRELNEGVPRIYRAMREFMLAKPEYADDGGTVTLTLRNRVSDHKETILAEVLEQIEERWSDLNHSQHRMIQLLFDKQEATIAQMAGYVGVTEQAIRYNLRHLENLGIVERLSDKMRDPKALYRFRSG